jgi:hypothetical protein
MPTFFPSVLDLDISVDEFLSHCNSRDIAEIIEALKDDGYLNVNDYFELEDKSQMERDFIHKCKDLSEKFYQLDNEAIEYIESLHKKMC